jgi:hypothetical protein
LGTDIYAREGESKKAQYEKQQQFNEVHKKVLAGQGILRGSA